MIILPSMTEKKRQTMKNLVSFLRIINPFIKLSKKRKTSDMMTSVMNFSKHLRME